MSDNHTDLLNEVRGVWREEGAVFQFGEQNVVDQMFKPIRMLLIYGVRFECFLNVESAT
jgi:hypothetical protein